MMMKREMKLEAKRVSIGSPYVQVTGLSMGDLECIMLALEARDTKLARDLADVFRDARDGMVYGSLEPTGKRL